uniref:Phlebovirus_G2 domain-containing protein n=1 Tax=Heterorhabditis bacteriophora TaxID=37862 RepID=A0A1I7X262_HETBA
MDFLTAWNLVDASLVVVLFVFSCSTFDTKIDTSITLTTNNHKSVNETLVLSPGHIAHWNNISINTVSTSLPNIPILGYSFLRNIHSNQIRLLTVNPAGQPQAGMIGQLQCKSKLDAERSNCIFVPNVCKCHPTEDTVNCHCSTFNHSRLFKENDYTLPLSPGNINLRTDKKDIIKGEVTSSTSIKLLITANNVRVFTKRYDSSCNAATSPFFG